MNTIEEAKRELEEKEKLEEVARLTSDEIREMVIKKTKEWYNRDPTEEEIIKDTDFIDRCLKKLHGQ